ncbi:GRIP and coiled-coil domain-containing protein [Dirofilaria immitis]
MYRWNLFLIGVIHVIFLFALLNASCFISESGYVCCDKELERMMKNVINEKEGLSDMVKPLHGAKLSNKIENFVALNNFAYKEHFKAGKACKVQENRLQALA